MSWTGLTRVLEVCWRSSAPRAVSALNSEIWPRSEEEAFSELWEKNPSSVGSSFTVLGSPEILLELLIHVVSQRPQVSL